MFFGNIFITILIWTFIIIFGALLSWILFHAISWLIMIIICLTINFNKDYFSCNKFYRGCLNYIYWMLIAFGRVRLHVTGLEKIPENQCFMYVCNHRSKFDHMILSYVIRKRPVAFISKKENFKIPFVRRLIKRCCYLALDRGNIKSSIETIHKSSEMIKTGTNIIGVFPEGTRSKDEKILDFMPGCFKIATSAKCPIVVCAMKNTQMIHKNFPWKPTHVYLDVLDVLSAEEVATHKTVELSQKAYELVKAHIEGETEPKGE